MLLGLATAYIRAHLIYEYTPYYIKVHASEECWKYQLGRAFAKNEFSVRREKWEMAISKFYMP